METTKKTKTAKAIRSIAFFLLLIAGLLVFVFALLSGSETYGGGLTGIIKNSPNALPWALLLLFTLVARKKPIIGSTLVVAFGVTTTWLFNFSGPNFFWFTFGLTSSITLLGFVMMIATFVAQGHLKPGKAANSSFK